MKKLIFLVLLIPSIICSSQDSLLKKASNIVDSTKSFVKSGIKEIDTSSNFSKMYSDVRQSVIAIAGALKVGAEHVYEVLVKQQIVKSIVYTIVYLVGAIMFFNWIKKYKSDEVWQDGEPTGLGVIRTIQIVFSIIIFVIFVFSIDTTITGFINPEYGAIKDIIDLTKPN